VRFDENRFFVRFYNDNAYFIEQFFDILFRIGTTQAYRNAGWTGFNIIEEGWKTAPEVGGISLIGYVGNLSGNLVIPSTLYGESVVSIGPAAFANENQLLQVSLPSRIENIGDRAFENCTNLTSVSAMDNLEHIRDSSMYSLKTVQFYDIINM
jgi:cell surface protein